MHAEVCCQNHVVNCIVMHFHIVICVVIFHFPLNITWECRDRKVPAQLQVSSVLWVVTGEPRAIEWWPRNLAWKSLQLSIIVKFPPKSRTNDKYYYCLGKKAEWAELLVAAGPSRDSCDRASGPVLGETYHSTRLRRITISGPQQPPPPHSRHSLMRDWRKEGHGSMVLLRCYSISELFEI